MAFELVARAFLAVDFAIEVDACDGGQEDNNQEADVR